MCLCFDSFDSVHVIHADFEGYRLTGQYQYAVLSVNCNYPIYVLARDPAVFRQVCMSGSW